MNKAFDTKSVNPGWRTPLCEVWNPKQYFPWWLFYLEIGFVVAIILMMYWIRPFRPQKLKKKKSEEKKDMMSTTGIRKYKPGGER